MSDSPIRFLSMEYVRDLHRIAVEDQGGDPSVRDIGLLDSALAMPKQQFGGQYLHGSIPAMAAAYAFHICKNHPFFDGNKRAAFASMIAFLTLNSWSLDAAPADAESTILAVADGSLSKEKLTEWVFQNSHQKPSIELREFFLRFSQSVHAETFVALASPGSNQTELDQTIEEAQEAIPLIADILEMKKSCDAEKNAVGSATFRDHAMMLLLIYRAAEDQGYEW